MFPAAASPRSDAGQATEVNGEADLDSLPDFEAGEHLLEGDLKVEPQPKDQEPPVASSAEVKVEVEDQEPFVASCAKAEVEDTSSTVAGLEDAAASSVVGAVTDAATASVISPSDAGNEEEEQEEGAEVFVSLLDDETIEHTYHPSVPR